jgi:hypothetical protein
LLERFQQIGIPMTPVFRRREEANAHEQSNAYGARALTSIKGARASIFLGLVISIIEESLYSYYTIL